MGKCSAVGSDHMAALAALKVCNGGRHQKFGFRRNHGPKLIGCFRDHAGQPGTAILGWLAAVAKERRTSGHHSLYGVADDHKCDQRQEEPPS